MELLGFQMIFEENTHLISEYMSYQYLLSLVLILKNSGMIFGHILFVVIPAVPQGFFDGV